MTDDPTRDDNRRAAEAAAVGAAVAHAMMVGGQPFAALHDSACRLCGCTDENPCEGGCYWVSDPQMVGDLCSSCRPMVEAVVNILRAELLPLVMALANADRDPEAIASLRREWYG